MRGYRFNKGQGLFVVQSRCLKKAAYTVYIKASLDQTRGYRRILGSEGWVDHGIVSCLSVYLPEDVSLIVCLIDSVLASHPQDST